MSLAGLGEFGLIARIRAAAHDGTGVLLGIGDDCSAVLLPPGEALLTTTDLLIEGVHFRRDWTDFFTLGRKSVAVNLSDIAAMGGTPRQIYLGLALPEGLASADFDALTRGVLEATEACGATLAGGDTCRSLGPLLISITAQGSAQPEQIVRRSGAQAGDVIYVSGTLGDSALALCELLAGRVPTTTLAQRHHDPTPRIVLGQRLAQAGIPTAMIDLSDGLISDLGHLLTASKVGARIEQNLLPLSDEFRSALAHDPLLSELALGGGEDYELLFTAPPHRATELERLSAELRLSLTRIGVIQATPGLVFFDQTGAAVTIGRKGYNHFG